MKTLSILATVLLLASSCATDGGDRECSSDDQCSGGDVCAAEAGRCLTRASSTKLALEVLPPSNNQGWVRQEFVQGGADLQLEAAVSLQGIVHASDAPAPLPARVRVWRPSEIPGRQNILFETSTPDKARNADDYVLWLTQGHKYSLFVSPQPPHDLSLPPALESGLEMDDHAKKDVVLDGEDRSVRVAGKVFDAAGKPLPFSTQVRAYHEGGWLRSTPALSCSERGTKSCSCPVGKSSAADCPGGFALRIPFGVRTYTMVVEPAGAEANQDSADNEHDPTAIPTLSCTKAVLGLLQSGETQITLEEPLRMPAFQREVDLTLTVLGSDDSPVVGAQVTFEIDLPVPKVPEIFDSCSATYRRSAITDDKGKVVLPLLPYADKDYRLTVISPPQSGFRSFFQSRREVVKAGAQTVTLDPREELRGTVVDAAGQPLANTLVEARGFASGDVGGVPPTDVSTTTDADGSFVLYVDPKVSFHLHFRPPASSGAPFFSSLSHSISGSVEGLRFTAPTAALLVGQVLLPTSKERLQPEGAADFTITAFGAAPISPTQQTAVRRGTAVTSASGEYRLLVPRLP
jgi:hypothetical protein